MKPRGRPFTAVCPSRVLYDERTGERFDYTRKSGVIHTEILAPSGAPDWVYDRQQLWANVELASSRKDAQVAREFMLPLPHELTPGERLALERARTLIAEGLGPAPAPDERILSAPVDLKKISPSYHKAELDKLWTEAKGRHEQDRKALAAAEKAAREGLQARYVKLTQTGFLGLLVRTTGLRHLFEAVYTRQQRKIEQQHAALRTATQARHENEVVAIREGYQTVRQRVLDRLAALKGETGRRREEERTEALRRDLERTEREITMSPQEKRRAEFSENADDITQKKSRGLRRTDSQAPNRKRGRGYGYRRKKRPGMDDSKD